MYYPRWYTSSPPRPLPLLLKQPSYFLTISSDSMDYLRSSYQIEIPSSPVGSGRPFSSLLESNSQCLQHSIPKPTDKWNELTEPLRTCCEPLPTIDKTTGRTTF